MVTENRAAVLAALRRGECDGLLPTASEFPDDFAQFLDERGLLRCFEQFPDGHGRRRPMPPPTVPTAAS